MIVSKSPSPVRIIPHLYFRIIPHLYFREVQALYVFLFISSCPTKEEGALAGISTDHCNLLYQIGPVLTITFQATASSK